MNAERDEAIRISIDLVSFLTRKGETLKEVGSRIGKSESLMCKIRKGQECLTMDNLGELSKSYNVPIPLLIAFSRDEEHIRPEERKWYRLFKKEVRSYDDNRHILNLPYER